MKWKWISTIVVGAVLCVVQAASAGQLEDGTAAHDRGDYATAVTLWRPLANQGVAQAQYFLGTSMKTEKALRRTTRKP